MQVRTRKEFCKGCNICVLVCPTHAFAEGTEIGERGYVIPSVTRPERCPNYKRRTKKNAVCEMCILTCPDQALFWDEEAGEP
ncbi:MAG: ferredoxin family protein [Methanomassiliicoccales archaeon]|nr:ferredoxin family protein [Methanomassiliicoccales archaeon]